MVCLEREKVFLECDEKVLEIDNSSKRSYLNELTYTFARKDCIECSFKIQSQSTLQPAKTLQNFRKHRDNTVHRRTAPSKSKLIARDPYIALCKKFKALLDQSLKGLAKSGGQRNGAKLSGTSLWNESYQGFPQEGGKPGVNKNPVGERQKEAPGPLGQSQESYGVLFSFATESMPSSPEAERTLQDL